MRVAARGLDRDDLVEHRRVVARQEGAAVDDHVDLVGAGRDRRPRLGELDVEERLARREARRHARDCTPVPASASRATATTSGRCRSRPRGGWTGRRAAGGSPFAHSARTLPGVSFPSSVVRSIIRIARSSAQTLDAFLIDRFVSDATRSWIPTASTGVTRPSRLPRLPARPSNARMSSCARSRVAVSRATDVVMARELRPAPALRAPRGSGAARGALLLPRTR